MSSSLFLTRDSNSTSSRPSTLPSSDHSCERRIDSQLKSVNPTTSCSTYSSQLKESTRRSINARADDVVEPSRFFCPTFKTRPEDESLYEICQPITVTTTTSHGVVSSSSSVDSTSSSPHGSSSSLTKALRRGSIISDLSSHGSVTAATSATMTAVTAIAATTSTTTTSSCPFYFSSPVLKSDHRVCLIPVGDNASSQLDHDTIRILCSGTYALHIEEETGRLAIVYIMIEPSLSILVWCRGSSSGLKAVFSSRESTGITKKSSSSSSSSYHFLSKGLAYVSREMQDRLLAMVTARFDNSREHFLTGLEEGYIDLLHAKDISLVETRVDLSSVVKRSTVKSGEVDAASCLRLSYGCSMSDTRSLQFLLSKDSCSLWYRGMNILLKELEKQKKLTDQRLCWLKLKYLQLYYHSSYPCSAPTPAEAIKAFGGRKWTLTANDASSSTTMIPGSSRQAFHLKRENVSSAFSSPTKSRPASSIGSPSKIGSIIGSKGKLLKKKKSTPAFSLFSSERDSSPSSAKKMAATPSTSLPGHQYTPVHHKYSISEGDSRDHFNRRSLRFSLRKVSSRHSFSFLSPFKNRRDSSSSSPDSPFPVLDPETASAAQILQSLRSTGMFDDAATTTSTSSNETVSASRHSESLTKMTSSSSGKSRPSLPDTSVDNALNALLQEHRYHPLPAAVTTSSRIKDIKRSRGWFASQKNLLSFDQASLSSRNQSLTTRTGTSITHSSTITFLEFRELYRSFMIRSRADIKDLFEKLCQSSPTTTTTTAAVSSELHQIPESITCSAIRASVSSSTSPLGLRKVPSPTLTSRGTRRASVAVTTRISEEEPPGKEDPSCEPKEGTSSPISCNSETSSASHVLSSAVTSTTKARKETTGSSKTTSSDATTAGSCVLPLHSPFVATAAPTVITEISTILGSMTSSSDPEECVTKNIVKHEEDFSGQSNRTTRVVSTSPSVTFLQSKLSSKRMSLGAESLSVSLHHLHAKSPVTAPSSPTPSPTTTIVPTSSLAGSDAGRSVASTISVESTRRSSLIGNIFGSLGSRDNDHHPFKKTLQQHLSKSPNRNRRASSAMTGSCNPAPTVSVVQETTIQKTGLLTRNHVMTHDALKSSASTNNEKSRQRSLIWDAIASASIVSNTTGIETSMNKVLSLDSFATFLRVYQREEGLTTERVKEIIERHEPDAKIRQQSCLSFEGFACYLMDKDNYAFTPETNTFIEDDLDETLSHYYLATSHNTYLTGHQLKGESSVDLYGHILRSGCRCIELDCWDGEDGFPVIYHGHTLTSKISFKKVIEVIDSTAFATSPFPVILSLENHCSLAQQSKMAQIFLSIFGDKLVTRYLFDSDFTEDPRLPSPNQLRHKILIKNKKLRAPLIPHIQHKIKQAVGMMAVSSTASTPGSVHRQQPPHRTNSLLSVDSSGSLNDDDDDSDDEDEEDDDLIASPAATTTGITTKSNTLGGPSTAGLSAVSPHKISTTSTSSVSYAEPSSSTHGHEEFCMTSLSTEQQHHRQSGHHTNEFANKSQQHLHQQHKTASTPPAASFSGKETSGRKSSQVAPELSDLVNYVQAVKFRGLFFDSVSGLITSRQPNQQHQTAQSSQLRDIQSGLQQQSKASLVGASASSSSLPKKSSGSGKKVASQQQAVIQSSSVASASSSMSTAVTTTVALLSTCNASLATSSTVDGLQSNSPVASSCFPSDAVIASNASLSNIVPQEVALCPPSCSSSSDFSHRQLHSSVAEDRVAITSCLESQAVNSLVGTNDNFSSVSSLHSMPSAAHPETDKQEGVTQSLGNIQEQRTQGPSGPRTCSYNLEASLSTSSTPFISSASTSVTPTNILLSSQQSVQQTQEISTTTVNTQTVCMEDEALVTEKYANPFAPCYQVPSLNEHTAKKLCRKSPLPVVSFTESQLMRSYPAGMRIDSSNFNPLTFWAFGLQMAAINYQTDDMGSAINTAFFEQNGSCGLIKKPAVMIDPNHVMFGRFNPWEKEFDGLYALDLTITVTFQTSLSTVFPFEERIPFCSLKTCHDEIHPFLA